MRDALEIHAGSIDANELTSEVNGDEGACANILGVAVEAVDMERALAFIHKRLAHGGKGYVCAVGVHGILCDPSTLPTLMIERFLTFLTARRPSGSDVFRAFGESIM